MPVLHMIGLKWRLFQLNCTGNGLIIQPISGMALPYYLIFLHGMIKLHRAMGMRKVLNYPSKNRKDDLPEVSIIHFQKLTGLIMISTTAKHFRLSMTVFTI